MTPRSLTHRMAARLMTPRSLTHRMERLGS
jgi:hypothetical protein